MIIFIFFCIGKMGDIPELPRDIYSYIFSYIDDDMALANLCSQSSYFNKKICGKGFWVSRIQKYFPLTPEEIEEYRKGHPYWAYYLDLIRRLKRMDRGEQAYTIIKKISDIIQGQKSIPLNYNDRMTLNIAMRIALYDNQPDIFLILMRILQRRNELTFDTNFLLYDAVVSQNIPIINILLNSGASVSNRILLFPIEHKNAEVFRALQRGLSDSLVTELVLLNKIENLPPNVRTQFKQIIADRTYDGSDISERIQ